MAAQYRRAAQPRGYRPRRVDQTNIRRMQEDTNRTVQGMRQRAEMEIADRRRVLAQQKADQAATRRMEEKNFQIQTQNSQNELRGLQLEGQRLAKQAAVDMKATSDILGSISNLSNTASKFFVEKEKIDQQNTYNSQIVDASTDEGLTKAIEIKLDTAVQANEQLSAVQGFESNGGDPYVAEKVKARSAPVQALYGIGSATGLVDRGGLDDLFFSRVREKEAALGGPIDYDSKKEIAGEVVEALYESLNKEGFSPAMMGALSNKVNARISTLLGSARREEQQVFANQRLNQAIALVQNSSTEDLATNWSVAWPNVVDYYKGDYRQAWQAMTPTFTAIDQKTGNFLLSQDAVDNLPLDTEQGPTTFGERFTNRSGQPVGIRREIIEDRNRARVQWETQQEQAQRRSNKQTEDELARAFLLNPTVANGNELIRMYSELTGGESSTQLNNLVKLNSIEGTLRANEFERIAALPDYELTPVLLAAAKELNPGEYPVIEARYNNGPGLFRTEEVERKLTRAMTTITGTTKIGTPAGGLGGSENARIYFRGQIMQKAKLAYGEGKFGTGSEAAERAVSYAIAEESSLYADTYRTEGSKYYRKVNPNGTVSYPWIDARAGNVNAAEKAIRDFTALKEQVKSIGFRPVLNIPNSFMSAERMEYVAQNYGQPGFQPTPLERAVQGFSAGMPLHEIYNRAFAAAGRKETFEAPEVVSSINFTPEQQRIINDTRSSYQSKLNVVNVASGNTGVYRAPSHMRRGFMLRKSATSNSISSVLDQLTDADWDELGYVVSGEAARNTDDEYGVAANVLTRLVAGTYGKTIADIIRQPDQYEAVMDGSARYEPELSKKLKSPEGREKIKRFFELLDGRTEFKGQSQLRNRVPDEDPMFAPTGNFYHYAGQ